MEGRDALTNEKLAHKFKSQFQLVNYSISLVKNMVHSGRAPRIRSDIQNPAVLALEEIFQGKDQLDDLTQIKIEVSHVAVIPPVEPEVLKSPEKKKPRRIL